MRSNVTPVTPALLAQNWRERGRQLPDGVAVDMNRCPLPKLRHGDLVTFEGDMNTAFVTCDQCRYQERPTDGREYRMTPPHDCPHAWWDDEYGVWREAADCAPTCHIGLPKITPRPGGCLDAKSQAGADAPA